MDVTQPRGDSLGIDRLENLKGRLTRRGAFFLNDPKRHRHRCLPYRRSHRTACARRCRQSRLHFTRVNPDTDAQRREIITYPVGIDLVKPRQNFLTALWADAKALLVSHWPVETVSAKLLTTELFKRQSANVKLGRAQAVREASLAVMQQNAKPERGQTFSYAHPMFWAPFVVYGDGG